MPKSIFLNKIIIQQRDVEPEKVLRELQPILGIRISMQPTRSHVMEWRSPPPPPPPPPPLFSFPYCITFSGLEKKKKKKFNVEILEN